MMNRMTTLAAGFAVLLAGGMPAAATPFDPATIAVEDDGPRSPAALALSGVGGSAADLRLDAGDGAAAVQLAHYRGGPYGYRRPAYRYRRPAYRYRVPRYRRRPPVTVIQRPCSTRIVRRTPRGKVIRVIRHCGRYGAGARYAPGYYRGY